MKCHSIKFKVKDTIYCHWTITWYWWLEHKYQYKTKNIQNTSWKTSTAKLMSLNLHISGKLPQHGMYLCFFSFCYDKIPWEKQFKAERLHSGWQTGQAVVHHGREPKATGIWRSCSHCNISHFKNRKQWLIG